MSVQGTVGCGGGFRPAACVLCCSVQWVMDGASHCAVKKMCLHGGGQAAKLSPTQLGSKKPKHPGSFCGQGMTGAAVGCEDFYRGVCSWMILLGKCYVLSLWDCSGEKAMHV